MVKYQKKKRGVLVKKLITLLLAICMVLPLFGTSVYAEDHANSYGNPLPVTINDDSVLILSTEDETIDDIELSIPDSLEYQEIVLPYGTDLSEVKFTIKLDKLQFSVSEELRKLHGIDSEYLNGYFYRLKEDELQYEIEIAKNDGDYENIQTEGFVLEEGATYTISLDGRYFVRKQSIFDNESINSKSKKRWMEVNQSRKFAFTVSVADPIILEGSIHEIVEGTDKTITIKVENDFSKFVGVECDDKLLTKDKDYTAVSGSTVVTLTNDFVKSLKVGEHKIKILFAENVSSTATIKVTAKQDVSGNDAAESPKTGDYSTTGIMMILLVGAVATITVVSKKRRYS